MKKRELRLQLVKIQVSHSASSTTGDFTTAGKSLGDLEVPQKTFHPQPWPHIFAPGEPKLFANLITEILLWSSKALTILLKPPF